MRKLTYIPIMVFVVILFSSSVFAGTKITEEYNFVSYSPKEVFTPDANIKKDGKVYRFVKIQKVEVIEQKVPIEKVKTYTNLKVKKIPSSAVFKIDGKDVKFKLNPDNVVYTKNNVSKETNREYTGYDQFPDELKNAISVKKETVAKPFKITGRFIGGKNSKKYKLNNKEIILGDDKSTPKWGNYKKEIKEALNLSDAATIKSGKWSSGYLTENGETVRYATFSGTRPSYKYTANYKSIDTGNTYNAVATYSNGVDSTDKSETMKVYVEYKQVDGFKLNTVILATSIGILLLAALIVGIMTSLRRKKSSKT